MYLTKFHPTFKETVKYKRKSEAKQPGKRWLPIEIENSSNKKELKKKHTNIHTSWLIEAEIWEDFISTKKRTRYYEKEILESEIILEI